MPSESIYEVFAQQKTDLLLHLFETESVTSGVVIYIKTKEDLHAVTTALSHAGIITEAIHAGKKPELRDRAIAEFGSGKVHVLTMSEAVGRGIDIAGVNQVINFDIPELDADYGIRYDSIQGSSGEIATMITPKKPLILEKLREISGNDLKLKTASGFSYATRLEKVSNGQKGKSKTKRSKPLQNKKPKLRRRGK